jgi:hypothetical protein
VRAGLCGLFLLVALPLGARAPLAIQVSPAVSFAPATLVVRAMVEADANNRAIEVVAESGDFYRSSQIELDGDKAPRTTVVEFRSLPGGKYYIKATLIDTGGQPVGLVRREVSILGHGAAR